MRTCEFEGCGRDVYSNGLCHTHRTQQRRGAHLSVFVGRDTPAEARFWAKVDKAGPVPAHYPELGPCWIWRAGRGHFGHGHFRANGASIGAHRFSLALTGIADETLCVLHRCDNPPCVNPAHLFLGTRMDNNADRDAKGRNHRGERTGKSKLTDAIVAMLRQDRAAGVSIRELGRRYAVHSSTALRATRGNTWKHI